MARLENNFTWSASRAGTLRYCDRNYWLSYYGSWGGWEFGSDPEVRLAYTLKNLHNRWTWAGTVVHEAIESVLRRLQGSAEGGDLLFAAPTFDVDEEVTKITTRMREDWRTSRGAGYRNRPKKVFGLMEHEYEDDVPDSDWKKMNNRATKAIGDFLQSDLFAEIKDSDPKTWLPIEKLDQFDFEGTPIWAVLDFGWTKPDGSVEIYDWKTGEMKQDAYRMQLGTYALYMGASRDLGPADVRTRLVFLGDEMQILDIPVSDKDLAWTRSQIRESIASMRGRLEDPATNVARKEDFPKTEDLSKCRGCKFRRLCDRV